MIKVKKDLTGLKFGRLTVIKQGDDYISPSGSKSVRWLCLCDCQKHLPENQRKLILVRRSALGRYTNSCGCLQKERTSISSKIANKKYNKYDLSGEYGVGYTAKDEEFYFDLEDYEKIKDYYWFLNTGGYVYAYDIKSNKRKFLFLHNLVMDNIDRKFIVDHIKHIEDDKNSCRDNRKENLRKVTQSKNSMNRRKQRNNTSGTTGVYYRKNENKWVARIKIMGKEKFLGYFTNYDDAVKARKAAEEIYFGEYSYSNSMKM